MSLARNTLVQASFTMLSRLLGYARDRAISNMLGAGWIGDAFATAQTFPNLFRRILAEGAFSQAFVPAYARIKKTEGDAHAQNIASDTFSGLTLGSAMVTIICQLAMPWIMLLMHGGYADQPVPFKLAILLTQLTMPYLVGMALSSLFSGVLNTAGKFALSAAVPSLPPLGSVPPQNGRCRQSLRSHGPAGRPAGSARCADSSGLRCGRSCTAKPRNRHQA